MSSRKFGRGRWWEYSNRRGNRIYRGVVLMHAHRGGAPVLCAESSWRTVNGVLLRAGSRSAWVLFRRPGRV